MKTFILFAALALLFVAVSATTVQSTSDKPMPSPVDFHKNFSYSGCGAAFGDIAKQITLLYGDLYGTAGLNTAFYRIFQFIMVRIPAWWTTCF